MKRTLHIFIILDFSRHHLRVLTLEIIFFYASHFLLVNCVIHELTSSAGFSAIPTSTTLLANKPALEATSVSAEAGQEQTLRTH